MALLPGASTHFTHGRGLRPASAAFFATRPAASIMEGSVAVVQLVTAAIASAPWVSSQVAPSRSTATCRPRSSPRSSHTARKRSWASASGMRSCGREGPAIERSTAPRSNSTTSAYVRAGASGSFQKPCAFA